MKVPAKTLQFSADIWIFSKQFENCDSLDNKWVFDFVITMTINIDIRIDTQQGFGVMSNTHPNTHKEQDQI